MKKKVAYLQNSLPHFCCLNNQSIILRSMFDVNQVISTGKKLQLVHASIECSFKVGLQGFSLELISQQSGSFIAQNIIIKRREFLFLKSYSNCNIDFLCTKFGKRSHFLSDQLISVACCMYLLSLYLIWTLVA